VTPSRGLTAWRANARRPGVPPGAMVAAEKACRLTRRGKKIDLSIVKALAQSGDTEQLPVGGEISPGSAAR